MLQPDVRAYLDKFDGLGTEPPYECSPRQARDNFKRRMAMFSEGKIEVGSTEDVTIPAVEPLWARIYRPLGATGQSKLPSLVFYHGGGWVVGDVDTHDHYARTLCSLTNSVVLSVNYRKAPEAPFPAAADDAFEGLKWAAGEVLSLGGDARRIVVSGVSAGGNLAAVAALEAQAVGLELALQALIYPCIDPVKVYPSMLENAKGYLLTKKEMDWYNLHYSGHAPEAGTDPRRSPIYAEIKPDLAPALVVTSEYDPLRDEGNAYAAKLAIAGIDTELLCFPGTVHGFFGFGAEVPSAQEAIRKTCAAINHKLSH